MGFDDDDFFAGGGGGSSAAFGNHDAFGYNDDGVGMGQYEPELQMQQQPRSQVRPTRQRRASLGVTSGPIMSLSTPIVPSKPQRTKSSDQFGGGGSGGAVPANTTTRSGSRRQPSSSSDISSTRSGTNSNNTLNGRLEAVPGRINSSGSSSRTSGSGSGDRSVASNGSNSQRRSGARRASMAAGIPSSRNVAPQSSQQPPPPPQYRTNHNVNEDTDYGYGYDDQHQYRNSYNQHEVEDMGYGDPVENEEEDYEYQQPVPQEEPVRSRRQRRCSIADVVNTASVQPTQPDYGYGSTESYHQTNPTEETRGASQHPRVGTAGMNASIANIAIPMTLSDEPKRTNRRGSIAMLGNIGRTKASKEPEPAATAKKPAADRDRQRQRQGNLLDRVGASASNDGRGTSRAGTTSYSDRIMSK